jgi:uncharacterized Zn-binding protein involved in type VI secretion
MGKSIARVGADYATTHTPLSGGSPHINSPYAGNGNTVYINGYQAVAIGDTTLCGEIAIVGSSSVLINGRAAHCNGDALDSHASTFTPSTCVASGNVYAG